MKGMKWERQVIGIIAWPPMEEETHDLSNRLDAGYNCHEGMIGERLRHYEILKRLGAGGQATAYLARDTTLNRTVVLKLLDPRMAGDELARKRFLREARLAATLNHPNICTIHELNEDRGYHFIVMEYVEGESLKALLERKRLSLETALAIALQVADGLAAAHRAGIVHRDLKTANIIIAHSGRPVILDFGLAKALPTAAIEDVDLTQASALGKPFGTASYMSPEQARGELTIDARSDVFSFGIILYEMLTGKKPFVGKGAVEIMHAILHDEPRPIRQFIPAIDPELEEFLMKALKKNPDERYASGVELLERLTAVAARLGLRDIAAVQAIVAATQERASLGRQLLGSLIDVFQSVASFIERLGLPKERPVGSLADHETSEATLSRSQTRAKLTLAILPLKSLTKSPAYEHFGVGLADTLITELAVVGDLIVRPLRTVLQYEGREVDPLAVGRALDVDVVLDGSFQVAGEMLRATLRLFDVRTGEDIWTDRLDHHLDELFALQDQVARHIIEGLRIHLTDYEKQQLRAISAGATAAYDCFVRGKYIFEKVNVRQDFEAAIELFRRAIEMDRGFVPAYSALAKSYFLFRASVDNDPRWLDEAERACRQAIALNPHFAESYAALANVYLDRGRKHEAYEQLRTALRLAPNDLEAHLALGWFYRWSGLLDRAAKSYRQALRIDPSYWRVYWGLIMTAIYQGQLEEAERRVNHFLIKIDPQHPVLRFLQGEIMFYRGDLERARDLGERLKRGAPDVPFGAMLLAKVYASQGEAARADEELQSMTHYVGVQGDYLYWRAQIAALQGRIAEALEYFQQSVQLGNENVPWFERDPTLTSLRTEARFTEMMRALRERWMAYRQKYE